MLGALEVATALLLGAAGIAKLLAPRPAAAMLRRAWPRLPARSALPLAVRATGLGELGTCVVVAVTGDRASAALLAAWYVGFAALTTRLLRRAPRSGCGCFGATDAPAGALHVALNAACAAIAVAAAVRPPGRFGGLLDRGVLHGIIGTGQAVLLAYAGYLVATALATLSDARRRVAAR